ncbi:MAG: hypothetical protein BM555_04760 [Crocinitomix sp. MedPE-SWsnd]|jgi:hypothetical protein|nr:MAG: hypothetical protein BM555_04760 [Crocinitomix sp. MedPE-SWsnd]
MSKALIIISLFFSTLSFGQYDTDTSDIDHKEPKYNMMEIRKRIYVGGDFSLAFRNQLYLYVAPFAGYDIYKGLSAGVSGMYQLYRFNTTGGAVSSHAYGAGVFTRFKPDPLPFLLLQAEFDIYNAEDFTTAPSGDRTNLPAFMMGAGYAGNMGRAYYSIMLMYDFIDDVNNPLPPIIFDWPLYLRYGIVFHLG